MTSPGGRYPAKTRQAYASFQQRQQPRPGVTPGGAGQKPRTDMQQAGIDIQGVYNPVIKQLTDSIQARAKAGMGAIGGYTNQLASSLSGVAPQLEGIYGRAQQSQAATNTALTGALSGSVDQGADDLSARLAQIGMGSGVADEQRQIGAGAGGAMMGMGSASLSQLISQGAAAGAYGASLPATARLGGLAGARELQLSSGRELADRTGQLTSEIPGAVLERADYLGDTRRQQQEAGYGRWQDTLERRRLADETTYNRGQDRLNRQDEQAAIAWEQKLAASAGLFGSDNLRTLPDGSLGVIDPQTGKVTVVAQAPAPAPEAPDPNTYKDPKGRTVPKGYQYDDQGRLVKIPTTKAPGSKGKDGLTPNEYAGKLKDARKAADLFYYGDEAKDIAAIGYQEALEALTTNYSLTLEDAQKTLNQFFKPGEEGRPYISFQQRERFVKAGLPRELVMSAAMKQDGTRALVTMLQQKQQMVKAGIPDRVINEAIGDQARWDRLVQTSKGNPSAGDPSVQQTVKTPPAEALRSIGVSPDEFQKIALDPSRKAELNRIVAKLRKAGYQGV